MGALLEILAALVLSVALWCVIHRLKQVGKPGFKTWPLLGATLDVFANYHRLYDWILWNFKDVNKMTVAAPTPLLDYVFTVDPVIVEHILKTNFQNYPKGAAFHERFEPLLGNGIFNSDGETWKIQRKTASFEFSSRVLRDLSTKVFKEYALKLFEIVEAAAGTRKELEMQDLFMRMTLDTICNLGFGVRLGVLSPSLPKNEFAMAFDNCNAIIAYRFADPLWKVKKFFRIGDEGKLVKYIRTVDSFTYNIIRQRRLHLKQVQQNDILSRFMMLDDSISDTNLRDIVLNFIIAGRDTTASTLSHFIYMISSHPECAQKLYNELTEFEKTQLKNSSTVEVFSELLTYESVSKLVYLHASLNETLRLYPAVPLNFKGVLKSEILPDGTPVKQGDIIGYVPYCMGRMEELWGADAAEFRPERWFSNGCWDFNASAFKFTAFQAGPRICLGKDSAYLQLKITAAILCRFFKFHLVPNQNLTYRIMATISLANGVKVIPELYTPTR